MTVQVIHQRLGGRERVGTIEPGQEGLTMPKVRFAGAHPDGSDIVERCHVDCLRPSGEADAHRWQYRVVYQGGDGAMEIYWTDSGRDAALVAFDRGGLAIPCTAEFWRGPR